MAEASHKVGISGYTMINGKEFGLPQYVERITESGKIQEFKLTQHTTIFFKKVLELLIKRYFSSINTYEKTRQALTSYGFLRVWSVMKEPLGE